MQDKIVELITSLARDMRIVAEVQNRVVLDLLLKKGIVTYAEVQESISVVRETIPKENYSDLVRQTLDVMEQTYQDGTYHSPLD